MLIHGFGVKTDGGGGGALIGFSYSEITCFINGQIKTTRLIYQWLEKSNKQRGQSTEQLISLSSSVPGVLRMC